MKRKSKYWQLCLSEWLREGQLQLILPEVAELRNCPQSPEFHAEGDALTHTLLTVEAVSPTEDERVFWGALLHDIGKAKTTQVIKGRIRSFGHQNVGSQEVASIMRRLNLEHFASDVAWLVKYHHFALSWDNLKSDGLTKKQRAFCQHPLFPLLVKVARADDKASHGSSTKGELLDKILAELGKI